jgi:hypothetical protein
MGRHHQVSLMGTIYSSAANVAIYLGEASEDSDLAVDFIRECDEPSSETNSLSFNKSESLIHALSSFFHRLWFTRVWVIQEAVLPASGIVYCGNKTLSWSTITYFRTWNTTNKWLQQLPFIVSAPKLSLTGYREEPPMLKLLIQARHCEATDPRDKIYSLLSLLKTIDKQFSLKPRYEDSVAKVYTDCALALMAVLVPCRGVQRLMACHHGYQTGVCHPGARFLGHLPALNTTGLRYSKSGRIIPKVHRSYWVNQPLVQRKNP